MQIYDMRERIELISDFDDVREVQKFHDVDPCNRGSRTLS